MEQGGHGLAGDAGGPGNKGSLGHQGFLVQQKPLGGAGAAGRQEGTIW
jgi:hypothetical protein